VSVLFCTTCNRRIDTDEQHDCERYDCGVFNSPEDIQRLFGRLTEDRRVLVEALKDIAATVVHAPEGGHEEVAECVRIARAALARVENA
jgi:hypothetical protein